MPNEHQLAKISKIELNNANWSQKCLSRYEIYLLVLIIAFGITYLEKVLIFFSKKETTSDTLRCERNTQVYKSSIINIWKCLIELDFKRKKGNWKRINQNRKKN